MEEPVATKQTANKQSGSTTRCWPGYEPVKGKKPHSQGSCRKKAASKTTSAEKSFRAKRKKQLDRWEAKHPHTRRSAAQHLHEPGSKAAKRTKS